MHGVDNTLYNVSDNKNHLCKVIPLFFLICLLLILTHERNAVAGESEMEKFQVVPDVIDKTPAAVLDVTYTGNIKVNQGNELTTTNVKEYPAVNWNAEDNSLYTLVMTDPDAPSRKDPKYREWHHWLVGNIPGKNVQQGEVLTEYIGSAPPKNTGLHRYVLLIFKQPNKLQFDEDRLTNKSGKGRAQFSTRNFAKKYKLGDPIAGNFFQAQWGS
ncbi:hypothetical protein RN001_007860 [Aquatica leii]|uniref:Uncharacterized protein n=1 Tax=Aquatica leii TaxID=1421715 RepID=A0AAN7P9H5_9COLE|nr:hypothetical protein RN001_007860 [Aquatica leii]